MRSSALGSYPAALRIVALVVMFACLAGLSGCWVSSINPLYEESFLFKVDPDVILDPSFEGNWGVEDEGCQWTLEIIAKEKAYNLTMTPSSKCKPGEKTSKYEGRLVKLDSHVFLDLVPDQEVVCDLCLPLHNLFLANIEKASLSLAPIDYEWLQKSADQKTLTLQTLSGRPDVITSSSKELKDFVRKYADDKSVFKPVKNLVLKRE